MDHLSPLQRARQAQSPQLPRQLQEIQSCLLEKGEPTTAVGEEEALRRLFPQTFGQPVVRFGKAADRAKMRPLNVGVVLSGGQAPGGHNVIAGLYDALQKMDPASRLIGFQGGPGGIVSDASKTIDAAVLAPYRNQGGFDLLGSGRTKIEKEEQLKASLKTMKAHTLDGLVIVGGDDSNTNAALLAEYFTAQGCKTQVVGVPKTIDGDLQNPYVSISFGFDSACKVYSELIGNIARDAQSSKKYTHFVKLMGRSASHITLECALQTHPNVALIGEEIFARKQTLHRVTAYIADVVAARAQEGKDYGVILVPEGLIEFIPEMAALIAELNGLMAGQESSADLSQRLTPPSKECFDQLPSAIQSQLLLDRDPHGNVQVAQIATEQLLMATVAADLERRRLNGQYNGKFLPVAHYFGYEGRAGLPSHFDSNYCYALGFGAALLLQSGLTGYMAAVEGLAGPVAEWRAMGVPLTSLMTMEIRSGKPKPVIQKALVGLDSKPFDAFTTQRQQWAVGDDYRSPGPMQFFGDAALTETVPLILA